MKLPKFLFKNLKNHMTSLGNNEAFPPDMEFPFDYYIIKKRYNDVCKKLVELEGEESLKNVDELINKLSNYISICKKIEEPIKDGLIDICQNSVNELFNVPKETVIVRCELVNKIIPNHSFRILPEDDKSYEFNDLNDFSNSNKVVLKRRLINSLIQGASYCYFSNYSLNSVYQLNNKLPDLYERIRAINDYLLFSKQENISDKHPMQGACVEVELGREGEKTEINVQGILFPYLFTETIRGFLELFASHGLPKDNAKAEYIIKHADFLLAEPWDLRFGVGLWELLAGDIEDTKIIPFFFSKICELSTDDFNENLKEVFAKTKKGKEYIENIINDSIHDMEMMSLVSTINTKNQDSEILINDGFMSYEELDNFVINEDDSDEETNDYWRYKLGGNKADADRVIYDKLDISLHWEDSGAIPFAWADAYDDECHVINKLIIGDEETTHGEVLKKLIINNVNAQISNFGENAKIKGKFRNRYDGDMYYFMQCPKDEYMDEETGAIECDFEYSSYLIDNEKISYYPSNDEWEEYSGMLDDCGRVWIYDNVIAFWSTTTPMLMKSLIDDLQTELNIDLMDFYYVYYDDNENVQCCTIKEFIGQNNDNYTYKPDDRTEVGNHLLPSDKKKETEQHKNFLNTRNEKDGKKLGNMTMAQYHNLIHQESKKNNKKIIKEGLYDDFNIEDADIIYFNKYQENWADEGEEEDLHVMYDVLIYDIDGNIIYEDNNLSEYELDELVGDDISYIIWKGEYQKNTNATLKQNYPFCLQDFNTHDFGDPNESALKIFKNNLTDYHPDLHGYIMQDGTCISLGYEDHNIITKIPNINDKYDFIALGNIRCSSNFFDLIKYPTSAQKRVLRKLIANADDLSVDIYDANNDTPLTSALYRGKIEPTYVLNQIDRFFSDGIGLNSENDYYEIDECFTYDEFEKLIITENEDINIENEDAKKIDIKEFLLTSNFDNIDFEEEQINLNIPLRKGKYFWQITPIVDGIKVPSNLINLKAESISSRDKMYYQLHININPDLRNKGIGYKLYKSFINIFGNAISLFNNRTASFYRDNNSMNSSDIAIPKIWDKLKTEPNIKVSDVKMNGKVIGVKAEIK